MRIGSRPSESTRGKVFRFVRRARMHQQMRLCKKTLRKKERTTRNTVVASTIARLTSTDCITSSVDARLMAWLWKRILFIWKKRTGLEISMAASTLALAIRSGKWKTVDLFFRFLFFPMVKGNNKCPIRRKELRSEINLHKSPEAFSSYNLIQNCRFYFIGWCFIIDEGKFIGTKKINVERTKGHVHTISTTFLSC